MRQDRWNTYSSHSSALGCTLDQRLLFCQLEIIIRRDVCRNVVPGQNLWGAKAFRGANVHVRSFRDLRLRRWRQAGAHL